MKTAGRFIARASTVPRRAVEVKDSAEKQHMGKALLGLIMVSLTLLIGLFVYATFIL